MATNGLSIYAALTDTQATGIGGEGAAAASALSAAYPLPVLASATLNIANYTEIPNNRYASVTTRHMRARKRMRATQAMTTFTARWIGWSLVGGTGGDQSNGASLFTVSGSIEYPVGTLASPGTRTRITFTGSNDGALRGDAGLTSDTITVSIPKGEYFYVWTWIRHSVSATMAFRDHNSVSDNSIFGNAFEMQTSAMSDVMTSGTFTGNDNNKTTAPSMILATTTGPSFWVTGDSRMVGSHDADAADGTDGMGEIGYCLSRLNLPWVNCSITGATLSGVIAAQTRQGPNWVFANYMVYQDAINDLVTGAASLATMQSRLASLKALVVTANSTIRHILPTTPPHTTGAWTLPDGSDQTLGSDNAVRVSWNDWKRDNYLSLGYQDLWEIADTVETARNSGLWRAPGFTDDGLHNLHFANVSTGGAGVINVARL